MAQEFLENVVYVYDKNMKLLGIFDGENDAEDQESLSNQMTIPTVKIAQNGESTFSYQMLANSWYFNEIKHPENIYFVNGRYYTPLNENSYIYSGEGNARIVDVTCVEIWYLLSKQYNQAFCCGLYAMAKATFKKYTNTGAVFEIKASDCSIPGNAISTALAWNQVKLWSPKDDKGNELVYSVLKSEESAPTGWDDAPASVLFKDFTVSGNTATVTVSTATKGEVTHNFSYSKANTYKIDSNPLPEKLNKVTVNITNIATTTQATTTTYQTYEKDTTFSYNNTTGEFSINYKTTGGETINFVSAFYDFCHIGDIKSGATCTFAYGAEVVDEHTFLILPKADKRYKLTIDGVEYDDSEVKDSRGVVMPRGSGGYAMWAALKNSGWKLGICDVIAKDFDTSIDYGCFNVETDMKDVLYNIQYIQQLYGGILDWNSREKVLNYRAENDTDYQSFDDNFNKWRGYEFRPDKNMKSQPKVTVDNNLITRGYLLGYGGLNVKKVNNGKTYIDDFSFTTDIYEGYLEQPLIYDTRDDGGMKQLLYWGRKELAKMCKPRKTISFDVFDIRTVEGYEHEVFGINDIVRAYSKETDTDEETYEEKRIIEYEYGVFDRWNSTVVLGDRTQNFSEIFKLIFNMTMDSPKTNGSGDISSKDVVMDNGDSLPQYLELLARTTTSNTDAIANLVLQTSNISSQVDLFALYQSQLDDMFTKTYAGLSFYADQVGSKVQIFAEGLYQQTKDDLANYDKTVVQAGFIAEQNRNYALAQQLASYQTTTNNAISNNLASMKAYADDKVANIELHVQDSGGSTTLTMTSQGIVIDSATFSAEPYGYDDIVDTVEGWRYGNSTFLDGSMIATDTIFVSQLYGGRISLLEREGLEAAYFELRGAYSYAGTALAIYSGAINIEAEYGDLFLQSSNAYIQLYSNGEVHISAPRGLYINGSIVQ